MDKLKVLILNEKSEKLEFSLNTGYEIIKSNCCNGLSGIKVDLIILCINSRDDLEELKLCRNNPDLDSVPIIAIIEDNLCEIRIELIELGADDYFIEPVDLNELISKMDFLLKRCKWYKRALLREILPDYLKKSNDLRLTSREKGLLALVAKGLTNFQIAQRLFLSELTVKTHLKNIFKKLEVSNRTEAVIVGLTYELFEVTKETKN